MGVKSTQTLTRLEAEEKFVDMYLQNIEWGPSREQIKALAVKMNNVQFEDIIENMNDTAYGGEGYENYKITNE